MSTTICAPATALGGAIGIIRISGPEAISVTDKIFRGKRKLSESKGFTLHYGEIENVDDVMVSVFRAPHSYTGEDSTEISFHGSSYIQKTIIELLLQNGCKMASPGEYTQRAFFNGKMDLSQAEAVADLIASNSKASHRIAMNQMRGGISKKLYKLRDELLQMTSLLELELDFSEEDVEFADRQRLLELAQAISDEIRTLTSSFATGNAIKNGVPVAIIGAPNVGKSTLLNALLEDDKAIVSEVQGTTRDVIEDTITIDGVLFRFIDTAGIRATNDVVEQLGIERSIKVASKAQIIILMTEPGVPYPDIVPSNDQTLIKIENKTTTFQAINGTGLDELKRQLLSSVNISDNDNVLITNARHYDALLKADDSIQNAIRSINSSMTGDLISEDLRLCLSHLSEIIGTTITPDEVLRNIFSKFCIGK